MDGLFKLLLGDNYVRPPKRARRSRPKTPWAFFSRLIRDPKRFPPYESSEEALEALAAIARNANNELDDAVEWSIQLIRSADEEASLGFTGKLLEDFLSKNPESRKKLLEKVKKVFDAYSDGGKVDPEALGRLIGNRRHHPQAIVDEMVGSFALLFEEVQQIKLARNLSDAQAEGLLVKFLEIDGMENFFEMALRQVQHEHGYIFEQLVTLCYLKKGFDPEMIILQAKIADKSGPDLLILALKREYMGDDALPPTGVFEVQIIQMKSYKNLLDVIRASDTGAALAQAKSDVKRLIRNLVTQDKAGAENIGLTYGSTLLFKIDWSRIQKDSFFASVDEMLDSYFKEFNEITVDIDGVVHKVDKAMIEGMDPNELLHSTDPVISKAVRQVFKKTHVDAHVKELNDALKGYQAEWADSFLRSENRYMAVDDIRRALQEEIDLSERSSVAEAGQRFQRVKNLFDDFPTDAGEQERVLLAAREELGQIYRSAFNLDNSADGVIKVEVDLVDSMIDDDIIPVPAGTKLRDIVPNPKGLH